MLFAKLLQIERKMHEAFSLGIIFFSSDAPELQQLKIWRKKERNVEQNNDI